MEWKNTVLDLDTGDINTLICICILFIKKCISGFFWHIVDPDFDPDTLSRKMRF